MVDLCVEILELPIWKLADFPLNLQAANKEN